MTLPSQEVENSTCGSRPKVSSSDIAGAGWLREGVESLRCIALMPQITDVICVKDDIASLET